ncbi:MAG TPA: glycosyltransferase family 4 protein [Longimicrobiales bacterium]|nr:glycosyltransferase family 4 protein [Longimicrobiales bacterium]
MRLLYLNHNVVHTGTFVRAAHLARELASAGHEVTLVTTHSTGRLRGAEREWCGVRIIEAPDLLPGAARNGWDGWNTAWRVRRLAAERFDLVHAFDSRPAVILPALAVHRRCAAPLVMDWADWWGRGGTIEERSGWAVRTFFGPVETWFEEAFRRSATAHTVIADSLRERCIGLGAAADRVTWLPNGCTPPAEHGAPAQAEARAQLGLPDGPLVLHLGVAFPADAEFLFAAFRRVRLAVPDARLALVGRFASLIPADLAGAVVRTGFVDDATLRLWLAAADAGVLVLRDTIASRGRWPGKLSDYLSGGVPIAMPAVGPAATRLGRAGAALLSDPTPVALGEAVLRLLDEPETRSRLAANSHALAVGELAWATVARRLMDFYEDCGIAGMRPTRASSTPAHAAVAPAPGGAAAT